ncbi:MAG: alpha-N-acetylglucosaminidase TIM-barrel domain-containing protein, partial [Bacteroidales bacterium]
AAACNSQQLSEEATPDVTAVRALAERVTGDHAKSFIFMQAPAEKKDFFSIEQKGRNIQISGNDANSMAVGLNYYLKYFCHVEYGWLLNDTFTLPARLPKVKTPVKAHARIDDRFFLNYCTYGYTMPWWKWADWEHFIDWMALNGVNLPLAITGQESIWYQIWTEMGLTDEEVRNYFTGPAHLPWHRMQNI